MIIIPFHDRTVEQVPGTSFSARSISPSSPTRFFFFHRNKSWQNPSQLSILMRNLAKIPQVFSSDLSFSWGDRATSDVQEKLPFSSNGKRGLSKHV